MNAIYKYPLTAGITTVEMPTNSKVLSVMEQHNAVVLYAVVDINSPVVGRSFYTAMTGFTLPFNINKEQFIGTVALDQGSFVCHVFAL